MVREYILKTSDAVAASPPAASGTAEAAESLRILRALAEGKHPFTGEELPEESCYQSAKVLRALLAGIEALGKAAKRKSRILPAEAGKSWSTEEDQTLIAEFEKGTSIKDLAQKHQRTQGAIHSRLMKLGKVPPPSRI